MTIDNPGDHAKPTLEFPESGQVVCIAHEVGDATTDVRGPVILALAQHQPPFRYDNPEALDIEALRGRRLYVIQASMWSETIPRAAELGLLPAISDGEDANAYATRIATTESGKRLHKSIGAAVLILATAIVEGRRARPIDDLDRLAWIAAAHCNRLLGMVQGIDFQRQHAVEPAVKGKIAKSADREQRALKLMRDNFKPASRRQTALSASTAAKHRDFEFGYLAKLLTEVYPGEAWPPAEWA